MFDQSEQKNSLEAPLTSNLSNIPHLKISPTDSNVTFLDLPLKTEQPTNGSVGTCNMNNVCNGGLMEKGTQDLLSQ